MLFASFSIRISMFFIAQRLFSTKTPIQQCTLLLSEQFTLERFRFLLPFTNNNVLHSHTMLYNGLNFAKRPRIHFFLSALGRWSKRAQFILTVNKTRAKTTQHHHQDNQLRYTRDTLELSRCIKLHPHQYGLLRIVCGRKTTIQAHWGREATFPKTPNKSAVFADQYLNSFCSFYSKPPSPSAGCRYSGDSKRCLFTASLRSL